MVYAYYNHNGRLLGKEYDYGNAAEAALFYEECTGNPFPQIREYKSEEEIPEFIY